VRQREQRDFEAGGTVPSLPALDRLARALDAALVVHSPPAPTSPDHPLNRAALPRIRGSADPRISASALLVEHLPQLMQQKQMTPSPPQRNSCADNGSSVVLSGLCFRPNVLVSVSGEGAVMMTTLNDVTAKKRPEPCVDVRAHWIEMVWNHQQGVARCAPCIRRDGSEW